MKQIYIPQPVSYVLTDDNQYVIMWLKNIKTYVKVSIPALNHFCKPENPLLELCKSLLNAYMSKVHTGIS